MQVTIATDLGKMVTRMQLERSEVAFFIYTNGNTLRYVSVQLISLTHLFDIPTSYISLSPSTPTP